MATYQDTSTLVADTRRRQFLLERRIKRDQRLADEVKDWSWDENAVQTKASTCKVTECYNKSFVNGTCDFHFNQILMFGKITRKREINPHKFRPFQASEYDLQLAKEKVKKRDNYTCQWGGCGKTNKETEINAHHCLMQSKYPKLRYKIQYMITYCVYHHYLWHLYNGDGSCAALLRGRLK